MEFITNVILPNIDRIGLVIIGAYLWFLRLKSGTNGLSKEINDEYKERNRQLNENMQSLQGQITQQGKDIAHLTGVIQEKDKHIESLTKLIQGRNPEIIELLTDIKNLNVELKNFMSLNLEQLKGITNELDYQTEILDKTKDRNEKIDQAHKQAVS